MAYAARSKYDEPGRAARYARRSRRRDAQEWKLLARLLDRLDPAPADALDVPCGTGRIAARLLDRGLATLGADLSPAMRAQTAERLAGRHLWRGVVPLDLELPDPPADLAADLVVCFRLLHHLPDAATRGRVLATLARLTRRHLLLSFHHPVSVHHARRRCVSWWRGRESDRYVLSPRRLGREAAQAGLRLVAARGLAPYRRELWVAWLVPAGGDRTP